MAGGLSVVTGVAAVCIGSLFVVGFNLVCLDCSRIRFHSDDRSLSGIVWQALFLAA